MGMFGLANNEKYKYPNYFQIRRTGPDPETSTALGFFELAARQNPKPQTVAIVGADAEYPQNALVGARELMKKFGFKTVYDKTYPPSTVDYTPDRAGHQGDQSRHRVRGVVSAGFGGHAARRS